MDSENYGILNFGYIIRFSIKKSQEAKNGWFLGKRIFEKNRFCDLKTYFCRNFLLKIYCEIVFLKNPPVTARLTGPQFFESLPIFDGKSGDIVDLSNSNIFESSGIKFESNQSNDWTTQQLNSKHYIQFLLNRKECITSSGWSSKWKTVPNIGFDKNVSRDIIPLQEFLTN